MGIQSWLDNHPEPVGQHFYHADCRGLPPWRKVLLCASEKSLNDWWAALEIDWAGIAERQVENHDGQDFWTLILLDIDGYLFSKKRKWGWIKELTSRKIVDFTHWRKRDRFDEQFKILVRELRTDGRQ